jgi:Domain of unknown function (DUF4281)
VNTLNKIFKIATIIALAGWVVLFLFPLWPTVAKAAVLSIVIALLCAVYTYLVFFGRALDAPGPKSKGSFSSLDGIITLFKSPRAVLAGWVHFLAFDLLAGLYVATDAARVGITHWWMLPVLFLTLMFGPAGLLLYLIIRAGMTGTLGTVGGF